MLYGTHPMLPIDIEFGIRPPDIKFYATHKYVQEYKTRLEWANKVAQNFIKKEQEHYKRYYKQSILCCKLEPGDMVLVRQKTYKGKLKIQDWWENPSLLCSVKIPA